MAKIYGGDPITTYLLTGGCILQNRNFQAQAVNLGGSHGANIRDFE